MASPVRFPWHRGSRSRIRRIEETSGFPRGILALFLAMAIGLGILISWALGLSIQVMNPSSTQSQFGSPLSGSADTSDATPLTTTNLGKEVQLLVDTGTLQNPANFDVAQCLEELQVDNSVLVLEKVTWENSGTGWLILHSSDSLGTVRKKGGEVSAVVVRSTCGTENSPGPDRAAFWSGKVLVAPLN